MKIKISNWNGKNMTLVREIKVYNLENIIRQIEWMNNNNIHGSFELVPENQLEKEFIKNMCKAAQR